MKNVHPLKEIVRLQKSGIPVGIYSICSANEYVIEAAMDRAKQSNMYVVIEATANQVNQFGGYTGMRPADFREFVWSIANKVGFPIERVILGGDHLGPLIWKDQKSDEALEKAAELIKEYVMAGFTKIHIDTSMKLGDDNDDMLSNAVIAERGADLCFVAEKAYDKVKEKDSRALHPVYVIGSEVPLPGGARFKEEAKITNISNFKEMVKLYNDAFLRRGLKQVWNDVIAVVVQLGVEFNDDSVNEYNHEAAWELCSELKNYPTLVFEGHSTDFQNALSLKQMVKDGIAILKVGPALTFALREGLFMLNLVEDELFENRKDIQLSKFIDVLESSMIRSPENWIEYYHGEENRKKISRKYSFSDRCRYYLNTPEVKNSLKILMNNLKSIEIPLPLISQYFPQQYQKIRLGQLKNDPKELLKDKVINVIDDYYKAVCV